MSSAMAAVALRRERRKATKPLRTHASHYSSVLSLARNRSLTRPKRGRTNSMGSVAPPVIYPREENKMILRILLFTGTVFLLAGLMLIFIGVGSSFIKCRNVGLGLIAFGAFLCFIKVYIQQKRETERFQRPQFRTDSRHSLYLEAPQGPNPSSPNSALSTPMLDGTHGPEFEELQVDKLAIPDTPVTPNSTTVSTTTPNSMNSAGETQALIVQCKEEHLLITPEKQRY